MVVLKYFSAGWCGPCNQQQPIVESIDRIMDDVTVEKHDVDDEPEKANEYNVRTVPTLFIMVEGDVISQFTGLMAKDKLVTALEDANQRTSTDAPL